MASAALDVGNQTLFLAPVMKPTEQRVVLPLFFPRFWATISVERSNATHPRTISLRVTKTYGHPVRVQHVTAQPIGLATSAGRVIDLAEPFDCAQGATLDLSAYWDELVARAVIQARVLPDAPPRDI